MKYTAYQRSKMREREPRQEREFMVWDGEGAGTDDQGRQNYVLLGCQSLDHTEVITGRSLRTQQCLDFIYENACEYSEYIHVAFAFNYDVDQMLKDMDDEHQQYLVDNGEVVWNEWRIEYIPSKMFKLKKSGRGNRQITICDAFAFFATSLIKAAKQYVPDHPDLEIVAEGKAQRNDFTYADLFTIIRPYWERENSLFLSTMVALRMSLKGAGINLESWHGPGAVANALIKKHRIGTHIQTSRDDMPLQVVDATTFAYFGGRFENWIIGHVPGPIYSYDIRSAYPAAMSKMPGLMKGKWQQTRELEEWGIYRYEYGRESDIRGNSLLGTGPLPNRGTNGSVSYGLSGSGWAYGHEIVAGIHAGFDIDISGGWVFNSAQPEYPFIFNHEMYVKRAQYKRVGNPAQLGLKLGMNSGYGKLAQTVGWDEQTLQPPKYHHQWYAGQITSWCRARILEAIMQSPENIIACETDGIYSMVPLKLQEGPGLGYWEASVYDEIYYVQNGFYFARQGECPTGCTHDGRKECSWTFKVRGLSTGKRANLGEVMRACDTLAPITTHVPRYGSLTGYVGRPNAHKWFLQERTTEWGGNGKRYHEPSACPRCQTGHEPFHRTVLSRPWGGASEPRGLPWQDEPELHPFGGTVFVGDTG